MARSGKGPAGPKKSKGSGHGKKKKGRKQKQPEGPVAKYGGVDIRRESAGVVTDRAPSMTEEQMKAERKRQAEEEHLAALNSIKVHETNHKNKTYSRDINYLDSTPPEQMVLLTHERLQQTNMRDSHKQLTGVITQMPEDRRGYVELFKNQLQNEEMTLAAAVDFAAGVDTSSNKKEFLPSHRHEVVGFDSFSVLAVQVQDPRKRKVKRHTNALKELAELQVVIERAKTLEKLRRTKERQKRKQRKKGKKGTIEAEVQDEIERLTLLCVENEVMTKRALNLSAFFKLQSHEYLTKAREAEADVLVHQKEVMVESTEAHIVETERVQLLKQTKDLIHEHAQLKADPWRNHTGIGSDLNVVAQNYDGYSLGHAHAASDIRYPEHISIVPM